MKSKNIYKYPLRKKDITEFGGDSPAHKGKLKHAIDFTVPEGTPIYAALGGIITFVKQDSKIGGLNSKYDKDTNGVIIQHENNESTAYWHLKHNGAKVKINQEFKKGQLIGLSGNTGWSHKPHLHFEVFKTDTNDTLEIRFENIGVEND